jgi:hypothetical protein
MPPFLHTFTSLVSEKLFPVLIQPPAMHSHIPIVDWSQHTPANFPRLSVALMCPQVRVICYLVRHSRSGRGRQSHSSSSCSDRCNMVSLVLVLYSCPPTCLARDMSDNHVLSAILSVKKNIWPWCALSASRSISCHWTQEGLHFCCLDKLLHVLSCILAPGGIGSRECSI